jgi:prepilin-type N-terminal cleavage/methylation domain-containing protein
MKDQTSQSIDSQSARGFTLVEVLIATVLIGLSIAALVASNGTLTMASAVGTDQSTAEFLAEQIRELTTMLPVVDPQTTTTTFGPEEAGLAGYDDVDDFNGATFSPPIGADKAALPEFASFSQQVTVQNVDRTNFDLIVANHTSHFVRVTVSVLKNGRQITAASWIRAKY